MSVLLFFVKVLVVAVVAVVAVVLVVASLAVAVCMSVVYMEELEDTPLRHPPKGQVDSNTERIARKTELL